MQWMLAIWSLVPLPFLNPAWTSGSSWFTYCWSLAWRILSISLLACEMSAVCSSLNILWHCLSMGLEWKLTFSSPVATAEFSKFEPVCCSMSRSNYCFLTCTQISQEAGQVVWYSYLFKNFPQFVVILTVKGFSQWSGSRCFSGTLLVFLWFSGCRQFDLWFLCLF